MTSSINFDDGDVWTQPPLDASSDIDYFKDKTYDRLSLCSIEPNIAYVICIITCQYQYITFVIEKQ